MRYELNETGCFLVECPDPLVALADWVTEAPPQPCYSPVFVGVRLETGEWEGVWTDLGVPTEAEVLSNTMLAAQVSLTAGVQKYLDTLARSRGYDGILSLCSYATSTNLTFSAEGQAGVSLRDGCWEVGHQITADVLAGNRPIPTLSEVLDELPSVIWPA